MEANQTAFVEHFALRTDLGFSRVAEKLRIGLGLPSYTFGSEDATEWGQAEVDGVEVNISKPYEEGTLQAWDRTVPSGCNLAVLLQVRRGHALHTGHEHARSLLVENYGQRIADVLGTIVHYHLVWFGPGVFEAQSKAFRPPPAENE